MKENNCRELNKILADFSHELAQSLMVINTYALGGIRRLEDNNFTSLQLITAMKKIIEHVKIIEDRIHEIRQSFQEEVSFNEFNE